MSCWLNKQLFTCQRPAKAIFFFAGSLERHRKGKAGAKQKRGEALGKAWQGRRARPPSGRAEDDSVQKQAENLLLSGDRRVCVCPRDCSATNSELLPQPFRGLASGKPRMVSF